MNKRKAAFGRGRCRELHAGKLSQVTGGEHTVSDEALVVQVLHGDKNAFACLVDRHGARFRSIAIKTLGDAARAEEIVQDAYIKLWTDPSRFNPEKAKFTTWFYRVVFNACLDEKRRRTAEPLPEGYEGVDLALSASEQLSQDQTVFALQGALDQLSERHRLALKLSYLDGFSNQEAADIMDLNIKAFESLLVRARSKLRDMLQNSRADMLAAFE